MDATEIVAEKIVLDFEEALAADGKAAKSFKRMK